MRPFRLFFTGLTLSLSLAASARAEVPRVVTDIPVVASLVAQVMGDLGAPEIIVSDAGAVHGATLRPSQARALSMADMVIWVGPALAPWMADAVNSLAGDAVHLELLEVDGIRRLALRDAALFEDDHGHDHDHGHDNGEGAVDPHAWLDPGNALFWLAAIGDTLAAQDPDNADAYRANAKAAAAALSDLRVVLKGSVPKAGAPMAALHDAYHYAEEGLGLRLIGSVNASDAQPAGPQRLAQVRDALAAAGVACIWVEPGTDPRALRAVAGSLGLRAIERDPTGVGLPTGPDLYAELLRGLVADSVACATPE